MKEVSLSDGGSVGEGDFRIGDNVAKPRKASRDQPQGPGGETIAALKCLRDSGPESFEKLVADLLSALAGVPFRLSRSGFQHSADALSEEGFVFVEVKRYNDPKSSIRNELLGALGRAAISDRRLQLFVVAATVSLGAKGHREVLSLGEELGVAVLILDADSTLLPNVASIEALCATEPDLVLHRLENPRWRDPKKSRPIDLQAVRADLTAVRALPRFGAFVERLQELLHEPIWPMLVLRQNRRLALQIQDSSETYFRVPYEKAGSVRRKVENDLESWFSNAVGPEPGSAVVVGERFDGKTWCVLDWLLGRLATLPIPVFWVSSLQADGSESLEGLILAQIRGALGSFERHAAALLRRIRHQLPERGPWALIILDGLDEYRLRDPDLHLVWALESRRRASPEVAVMGQSEHKGGNPPEDLVAEDIRPCAVLCTCRLPSWRAMESRISRLARGRVSVLPIGPYDDAEFADALAVENQSPEVVTGLRGSVQTLLRRPRYLRLLINNLPSLDRYEEVTEDLLYWFDAKDQIRKSRPGAHDWSEDAYQEVLRDLARRHIEDGRLGLGDVRSALGRVTGNIEAALRDLESEGALEKMPSGKYRVRPEQLRVGMGIHLLDLLEKAERKRQDLATELRDALEPLPDSDPKVEWLRGAAVISLYQDGTSSAVVDTLIGAWLRSRNLPRGDIEQIRRLSSRLLRPLLRLAPESWSSAERNERMREFSKLVILERLEEEREAIGVHVRSWLRMVPTRGPYFIEDEPGAGDQVRSMLSDPSVTTWGLRQRGDSGLLGLQSFGLHLETCAPGLLGAEDLLALMAVRHIPKYYFNSFVPSEGLLFRRRLAEVQLSWFEERVREASAFPLSLRVQIIHHFLLSAERADLIPLAASIAPLETPEAEMKPLETDDPLRFMLDNTDVLDPSFQRPSILNLADLRFVWEGRLSGANLANDPGGQTTGEDLDFKRTLPAMAAWLPDLGAELVRRQMSALPARIFAGRHLWAFSIDRHAVLAEGPIRKSLVNSIKAAPHQNHGAQVAVGHVLLSLLPAMPSPDLLDALIDHHIGFEWRDLFEVAAESKAESLRERLLERIETEHDSRHLARLYYLLSDMAVGKLSPAQARKVGHSVEHGEGDERIGALAVAAEAGLSDIPAEVLVPIATGSDRKTLAPRYAGWLLAHEGEEVDQLPVYLRAVAAVKHPRLREPFLQEVELALGVRKGGTASTRNEHQSAWRAEEFPRPLVDGLSEKRFGRWATEVQLGAPGTRRWWTGLLIPLFRRALCEGHPVAERLWPLVYPFQRESFGGVPRFLHGAVDWVLCDLPNPVAEDRMAKHLLRGLILDCRSDRELLEVALGARYEGQDRMENVLESLLSCQEPEIRARAARVLGWLEGSETRLCEISVSDPSLWVRRIAEDALCVRRNEGFSHHWFEVFLSGESREIRWGAGQLFLESMDVGGAIWARRFLRNAAVDHRAHGEAFLLLRSAEHEIKDRTEALGKTFLGYSVSDLERLWYPWQRRGSWEDLEHTLAQAPT